MRPQSTPGTPDAQAAAPAGAMAAGNCEAAFRTWRQSSGALLPYVRSTPFVSLAHYDGALSLPDPSSVVPAPVPATAPGELLVLDLPGDVCLRTGLDLAEQRQVHLVLTFGQWYHPHGLVGDAATAALLLLCGPPPGEGAGYCLLLDHGRFVDGPPPADRFNNQYELTEDDLPTGQELQALGITGACLLSSAPVKPDLRHYAEHLASAGLQVRWHHD